MQFKFIYYKRIFVSDALVAELVDAHASGACWLSQWKFESSPGHHKKSSLVEVFFYGVFTTNSIYNNGSTKVLPHLAAYSLIIYVLTV